MAFQTRSFITQIASSKTLVLNLILLIFIIGCKKVSYDEPEISLDSYQIEDGFHLEVAVSEPFIEAPVAMDFDNQGRMWVVEMKGYMRNLKGIGDEMPNGVISIMEDLDHDGVADHSKIFLDSLVLPRAISHVYGGLLYAEPPNLWFVDIEDDKPLNRVLVDSAYAYGGNVEHQPNGLMMHLDNWIYNAKSKYRYQRKNGKWKKEQTAFRGQWGITKDNFGRLYYNTNSVQLMGDYLLPNVTDKNPYFKGGAALNKRLTVDQRVYPLHPTSVNRGYVNGVLDKDSLLVNVTSACGPLIYTGNNFGAQYSENAFVCAPEANVVKRNILTFEDEIVSATQALAETEFLASTDEGFRPVNLNNGPDGNMYIVDMHRGILQDKVFLTAYLKNQYAKKALDTIVGMGRILRVVKNENSPKDIINVEKLSTSELVGLLGSKNGWLRDRAQQLLVFKGDNKAVSLLEHVALDTQNAIAQIHALHTLNGLGQLDFKTLEVLLSSESETEVLNHTLVLLENYASESNLVSVLPLIAGLVKRDDAELDLYILSTLGGWAQVSTGQVFPILFELSNRYAENIIYQQSLISSLRGVEEAYKIFLDEEKSIVSETLLSVVLDKTILNKQSNKTKNTEVKPAMSNAFGYKIFRNFCATCHGFNGEGVDGLAPPLENSEYVRGSTKRLALVLLHGLAGPVHVNGTLYELNGTMPGLANNPAFTDRDIKNIISYLHSTFSEGSKGIDVEQIKALRDVRPKSGGVYSEKELLDLGY